MSTTAKTIRPLLDPDPPLVKGEATFSTVTRDISGIAEKKKTPIWWWVAFLISGMLAMNLLVMIGYLIWEGTGVWGLNIPVGWGWAIVNFVFWVGIGHAGTLISAVLFLFRQKWRTSINRFAEAMTIVAVICAGIFPGIHVGRIWVAYFMFPIPNQMGMWPNFRSPLLWDVFAVGTYFTASALFWFTGLIPDLATLRDRATGKIRKTVLGILSLGWRGGHRQWQHYEIAYLLLAAISTPLVLSVHSVVSTDFATSILPGWHTTIFPPYFVAGAIFSGFAMVLTLSILARLVLPQVKNYMTLDTLERMAKVMMVTGMMVGYAYSMEFFIAWYSGNAYERFVFINRAFGPYFWAYWIMVSCNVIVPQLFWFRKMRRSIPVLFALSIFTNIGMWFERFVIVMTLSRGFMPASWDYYSPSFVDILTFIGSFGLFFTVFLLFLRFVPIIAMAEVKGILPQAHVHHHSHEKESAQPGNGAMAEGVTS